MRLPDDAIGISDILAYRDCPRRMSYGMRRHDAPGSQTERRTPEAGSPAAGYGSAIHECIEAVEAGADDRTAIALSYRRWGRWLGPADRDRLLADLDIYRARDFPATRTVASEDELRVPLTRHGGRRIFFRFRLDRLYERIDAPGVYVHVDYKSSAHPKSQAQVDSDAQLWAYNWAIHEYFPECAQLEQVYDQLRFGQLQTRKSEQQRAQIRDWLVDQAVAIIDDNAVQDDGLLDYRHNDWCAWCPILESCPVVAELTDFALARIAALAPVSKEGRKTKVDLDPARPQKYAEQLPRVRAALAVLKRFDEAVAAMLKQMPDERRRELGFELRERSASGFSAEALQSLHDVLGDRFYRLAHITKARLESELADDEPTLSWALGLADNLAGSTQLVVARKEAA
jgi:hypothetical protein